MIETRQESIEAGHIILSPNLSAQWKTNVRFLYIAAFFGLVIGLGFASVGLWMILPFTGLEILALVWLIYYVARKCHRIEVIHFDSEQVCVEGGFTSPKSSWRSDLFWTRLVVDGQSHSARPLRLYLRGRQEQIEIGAFLNHDDKRQLLRELRQYLPIV